MKIKMLDTVEDTHRHVSPGVGGKEEVGYSTLRLLKDVEYADVGPDWEDRAAGLVAKGFAEKVTS